MGAKDFNRELNTYLNSRRGSSLKEQFMSSFKQEKPKEPEPEVFSGSTIEVIEQEGETFFEKLGKLIGLGGGTKKEEVSEDMDVEIQEATVTTHQDFEKEEKEFEGEKQQAGIFDKIVGWFFTKKEKPEVQDVESVDVSSERDFREEIEALEGEEERLEEQEQGIRTKKAEIVKQILDKFVSQVEFKEGSSKEEVKEVSKITLSVIKKLPKDELKDFKDSYEFSRFKEILKDNDLIKQAEKEESSG
tara:strand:+ start:4446 stop:5183 length:738 start_codon:yes stop_codon:yes gene_type:complete